MHRGKPLTFGVSGKLWKDALIIYDRETGSLWSHVTGRAIRGPLVGTALTVLPAVHLTWREWRNLYPEGRVLTKEGRGGSVNVYEDYFSDPHRLGIFGTRNPDAVLPGKEFVVGLVRGGETVAYPFRRLSRQPLVNDQVGGAPVLVVFSPTDASAVVFSRRVGNDLLTFTGLEQKAGVWQMRDRETGSLWRALDGVALAGRYRGKRLDLLPATRAFWFAWKGFHPTTRVWGE